MLDETLPEHDINDIPVFRNGEIINKVFFEVAGRVLMNNVGVYDFDTLLFYFHVSNITSELGHMLVLCCVKAEISQTDVAFSKF